MSAPPLLQVQTSFSQTQEPTNGAAAIEASGPPRWWVLAADWGNTLAGIFLMGAFLEGALINSVKFLFCMEGFLYAMAELFMVAIMALTPAEFGGKSRGCIQFAILMAGGIFFGFSGLVFPGCITNVTYVFRKAGCPGAGAGVPYAFNAVAHYGITCFMVGTGIGFAGVLKAPKDKLIGPFYGCLMYFLGAWTIGIFKFWGPVIAGGFDAYQNDDTFLDMDAPANAWTWNWWFGLLGAFFLTSGALIFGLMNGSYGFHC